MGDPFREAIRLKPDYAHACFCLGSTLLKTDDLAGAVAALREAIRLNPDHVEAHCNLGFAFSGKGLINEAIAAFKEAARINPDFTVAHYNLGLLFVGNGLNDEAITAFMEAVRIKPDFAEAHYSLGGALKLENRLREALVSFRHAHHLGSQRPGWQYPSQKWVAYCERSLLREARQAADAGLDGEFNEPATVQSRTKAARWLREVLVGWRDGLKSRIENSGRVRKILRSLKRDPTLAKLRDPGLLAELPGSEKKTWLALWALMDELWAMVKDVEE